MNQDYIGDFAAILARHSLKYVIVGGGAVQRFYPSESQDIDVLLLANSYSSAADVLNKDPSVASFSQEPGGMATGHFVSRLRLVRFDLLDPTAFSGRRAGDEFFDYVIRYRSVDTPSGRSATVPLVWYMRLTVQEDAWLAQVPKIIRDLRAGAPWGLQRHVRVIARRFGTSVQIAERLKLVKESARRAHIFDTMGTAA